MTAKELQEKCMALQRECNDKQMELRKQYAIEHNPVKVGDIITDHYHTIRVEKMSVYGSPIPIILYRGTVLTKQGVPKKRQPVFNNPVFQSNVKSVNGKPYKYVEEYI
jgi:hypothetical protein